MVRGIDTFKEFFKGFEDNYVIIGGTACEIHEDLYAQVLVLLRILTLS